MNHEKVHRLGVLAGPMAEDDIGTGASLIDQIDLVGFRASGDEPFFIFSLPVVFLRKFNGIINVGDFDYSKAGLDFLGRTGGFCFHFPPSGTLHPD